MENTQQSKVQDDNTLPAPSRMAVNPIMSTEEAKAAWLEYQALEKEVLQDDDYIYFVEWKTSRTDDRANTKAFASKGEADAFMARLELDMGITSTLVRRKKKSAFRKMARFFGLYFPEQEDNPNVEVKPLGADHYVKIIKGKGYSIVVYMDSNFSTLRVDATVVIVAPNGKTMIGVGSCSTSERKFKHPDHDIEATAFTRALNRGIADMVSWGEVSAEEVTNGTSLDTGDVIETTWGVASAEREETTKQTPKPEEQQMNIATFLAQAFEMGWTIERIKAEFGELNTINFQAVVDEMKARQSES